MPACSFCKKNYNFPKGMTVVQKDSSVRYYCSSKCRKNSEMGRLNKKVKWIVKSDLVKEENKKRQEAYEARQEVLAKEKAEKTAKKSAKKSKK